MNEKRCKKRNKKLVFMTTESFKWQHFLMRILYKQQRAVAIQQKQHLMPAIDMYIECAQVSSATTTTTAAAVTTAPRSI